jgi:diguanylate cyclase (GGDEF)-like protein
MLAEIISDTNEAVFLYGPEKRCIWANEPAKELTKVKGDNLDEVSDALIALFGEISKLPEGEETEVTKGAFGNEQCFIVARGSYLDDNGKNLGSYVRVKDITAEKRRMEKEMFAANHDALTGLYNKEYTFKKISDQLKKNALGDYYIACISICEFKVFNDVFGRDFGDAALIQVADWMCKYSDENCIYGRIAGDCFGSCLPKKQFIEEIVEGDLARFTVKMGDSEQNLVVQLGFCEIEEGDQDVSVLFDRAYMALESIRNDYGRHVAFFDKKIRDKMIWNQEISAQLYDAVEHNQIVPYLQPIADKTGKIVGAEALARWIHPENGLIEPAVFINVLERADLIYKLDRYIWELAAAQLAAWKGTEMEGVSISINVSPKDLYYLDIKKEFTSLVMQYDIDPKYLNIEITETAVTSDVSKCAKLILELQSSGFSVEIDDFGSGYSSLNMLKDINANVLKIDMGFLRRTDNLERAHVILNYTIDMAHELGMGVITEGVETKEQLDFLMGMGCKMFQGFYFDRPMPVKSFEDKYRGKIKTIVTEEKDHEI